MSPPRTRAESRLLWIAIAGLWANAIYGSIMLIKCGLLPRTYDGYRYGSGVPADWAFPTYEVATWIGVMAFDALVVSVLLRRVTGSVAGVCLVVGGLCGVAVVACIALLPMAMHAPATFSVHAVSLLFAAGWLIAMGIVSALVMLVVRDRAAEARLSQAPPEARVVPPRR